MKTTERTVLGLFLGIVFVFVSTDLTLDARAGARGWHLAVEATIAGTALLGILYLIRTSFSLRRSLDAERSLNQQIRLEAERWRQDSRRYLEGLSRTIDTQLTTWHLTPAEKEIAFLLLKGLSIKEIADLRKTTEKTARAQATAIYAKAGLASRSELAAFFLEDLLPPQIISN